LGVTATYLDYLISVETLLTAPAAAARELVGIEAEHEAAKRLASESLGAPERLATVVCQRVDAYVADARELLDAAGLGAVIPQHLRPMATTADSSPADVSRAETAVAEAAEALRLAVLRHRQMERDAEEDARRLLEARRQADESARVRAEQMAAARAARRQALIALVIVALFAVTILILR
jgi:hypothetical protein